MSLFSGPDDAESSAAEWAIPDQRPAIAPVHDAPDNGEAKTVAPLILLISRVMSLSPARKFTAMDAVALNILLAQTLAACAATALRLTSFTFIHTHNFTESENTSEASSFGAELKLTITLLQKLQAMQMQDEAGVNRLSIVSLDEIFSNTSPCVGAMACTQALGNLSLVSLPPITISLPHWPANIPNAFQNLHVSTEIGPGGSMHVRLCAQARLFNTKCGF